LLLVWTNVGGAAAGPKAAPWARSGRQAFDPDLDFVASRGNRG